MKYSFLGFGIVMAGLFGLVFIVMFQDITINNESEYYVLKEAMEASMIEAIDITCFRSDAQDGCGGVVKISEQKFVENFTRRFSASISGNVKNYEIQFYDIIESPPKASVVIRGLTDDYELVVGDDSNGFSITNFLSGILEYKAERDNEDITRCSECIDLNDVELPDINGGYEIKEKKYITDIDLSFI